jgi:proline iminopeptidase
MRLEVRGVRLFFDTEGREWTVAGGELRRRPTVLMLHGGPGVDHSAHRELGARLSERLHVIYLDHRGNGRSEGGTQEAWTLDSWAADVAAFVDALGLERPFVLGHSFGGYVAQAYAAAFPAQPGGLILAGTAPRFVLDRCLSAMNRLGGAAAAGTARRFFAAPAEVLPEYLARCYPLYGVRPPDPEAIARTVIRPEVADHFVAGEMQRFDLRSRLERITARTLVLSGALDVIATPACIEELTGGLTGADVIRCELGETGHEMLRDEPDRAAEAILEFCCP